ncbi:DUF6347 domain-containing protein [Xenorhabdus innexi]|uniref:Uncharacterized protein n=1 Tax=Xenorhabdus innexi TaxID=290109 RepID=A0A1N6MY99_9GAMM|nr:DUF6347 domain-containing protein [Xenorhabdus innexi]PHM38760.1 hypothetical protein Xinn_00045 [Xenorhabdus innexi]SIP73801.1 membrane hypothetical protein [Xenorhabdus innexi]
MVTSNLTQGLTMADFSNAVVRAFIDITIIGGIYFFLCSFNGEPSIGVYLLIYPLIATITISFEIILDNINASSDELTHKTMSYDIEKSDIMKRRSESVYRLWGMISLYALLFYIILTLPFYFLLQFFSLSSQINIWLSLIFSFLLVLFSGCFIVSRIKYYAVELYKKRFLLKKMAVKKEDSDTHIIFNYFLPWSIITAVIAGLLAYGYFRQESGNFTDVITVSVAAFSAGGTSYIISLWIAYVTQKQTIIDIKANLLQFDEDDKLDENSMYYLIHVFSGCVIAFIFIATKFLSIEHFSPIQITIIETVVGALSGIVGSLAGLLRGRTKVLSQKVKPYS